MTSERGVSAMRWRRRVGDSCAMPGKLGTTQQWSRACGRVDKSWWLSDSCRETANCFERDGQPMTSSRRPQRQTMPKQTTPCAGLSPLCVVLLTKGCAAP